MNKYAAAAIALVFVVLTNFAVYHLYGKDIENILFVMVTALYFWEIQRRLSE